MATTRKKPHDWTIEQVQMAKIIIEAMEVVVEDVDKANRIAGKLVFKHSELFTKVGCLEAIMNGITYDIDCLKAELDWMRLPWYTRYWRSLNNLVSQSLYAI
jgi:hypothetical protein